MPKNKVVDTLDRLEPADIRKLGVEGFAQKLARAVEHYPDSADIGEEEKTDLARISKFIERAERVLGESEKLFTFKLMVLGKAGRFEEAIDVARRAYAVNPNWATAAAVANVLRRSGDIEGAVAMFRAAAQHDPEDVSALLDIGDLYLENARWEPALQAYQEVLQREKNHPWAAPSSFYCQYRLSGDKRWLRKLKALATKAPDECGVEAVLAQMLGDSSADDRQRRAEDLLGRCDDQASDRK